MRILTFDLGLSIDALNPEKIDLRLAMRLLRRKLVNQVFIAGKEDG